MATGIFPPAETAELKGIRTAPRLRDVLLILASALFFSAVSRWPLRRLGPIECDEILYLDAIRDHWFPMHHTLFLALARLAGTVARTPYDGFVLLSIVISALALTAVWWWLRALTRPSVALTATFALGAGPLFWTYGASAASYTAIVLVGSLLLGICVRARRAPAPWYPFAAAALLAFGTGYREDIGMLWMPVFLAILVRYRYTTALAAVSLFGTLCLTWFGLMLRDVGGWHQYRAATAAFAHEAGYLNSVLNLGLVDGPLRYAVKLGLSLVWTLGLGLLAVPRGAVRALCAEDRGALAILLLLSAVPALAVHLLLHFGVAGYGFHYVPALIALVALGIGRTADGAAASNDDRAPLRLAALAVSLAAVFLFYPTDFNRPGLWGDFDRSVARYTRVALRETSHPAQPPRVWRTANSRVFSGDAHASRDSHPQVHTP